MILHVLCVAMFSPPAQTNKRTYTVRHSHPSSPTQISKDLAKSVQHIWIFGGQRQELSLRDRGVAVVVQPWAANKLRISVVGQRP